MLVHKHAYGYSQKKKHVTGRGFVDSLSNVFNSIKASAVPAMRSIGSYVSNNKDLIAKPLLGAVGSLAATGLTAGVPALLSHIMKRKQVTDPKYKEILESLSTPVTNIIGSGAALEVRPRALDAGGPTLASLRAAGTGGVRHSLRSPPEAPRALRHRTGGGIKKF
jgi:hypothetical protein